MAVTIDWGTRIIYIPKDDLTLVQTSPSEIRSMDLNWFRIQLKNLEDSEIGMIYPDTHRHNSEVSLGGLTYARVIEIINNFTITFEDGQYAVNLIGANSNIGDKVNVNQVSVRSSNSAGMISSAAIEFASYENRVTVDVTSGYSGILYPIGTMLKPVNNLNDALFIASSRGFSHIHLLSNLNIPSGSSIDSFTISSANWEIEITLEEGSSCINTSFEKVSISGVLSGEWNVFIDCWLYTVTNFCGWLIRGSFEDITLAPYNDFSLGQSYFDSTVPMYPNEDMIIRMNTNTSIACTNLEGYYKIMNCTDGSLALIGMSSGTLTLSDTCIGGSIEVSGIGLLVDQSAGSLVVTDGFMNKDNISSAVWDESLAAHTIGGTPGKALAITAFHNFINIDIDYGTDGTNFPKGTEFNPVRTFTDAYVINQYYKFNAYKIHGMHTILQNFDSVDFVAMHSFLGDGINFNSFEFSHCRFRDLHLSGNLHLDTHAISFFNCYLLNVSNLLGEATEGRLSGNITIAPGKTFSGIGIVVEGDFTTIDLQSVSGTTVSLDVNSGIITFVNAVEGCLIELNLRGGEIVLSASCVGGDFYAEGYGTLYNESNMHIKDNHLLALETIPPYILNSLTSDYVTVDTIGKAIGDAAVGGIAVIDDTDIHSALDSYTNKDNYKADTSSLATKSDINSLSIPTISAITTAVWEHTRANQISTDIKFVRDIEGGKWEIVNNQMIFYSEDNITEIARFNLYNENGVLSNTNIFSRIKL